MNNMEGNKSNTQFLTYSEFMNRVGDKRSKAVGMKDITMMKFDIIYQNESSGDYEVQVELKDEYHKDYSFRDRYEVMDNACMIHWGQWLDIGIMTKLFPNLLNAYFFVTNVNVQFREPCFIDQPMKFTIKMLLSKEGRKKHEFVFMNLINNHVIYKVNFTVMNDEPDVLEHYYNEHKKRLK